MSDTEKNISVKQQILISSIGGFIGGFGSNFALLLFNTHFDFIAEWALKIIIVALGFIAGGLIGWKISCILIHKIRSLFEYISLLKSGLKNMILREKTNKIVSDFNKRYDRLQNESDSDYNKRMTELAFGKKQ